MAFAEPDVRKETEIFLERMTNNSMFNEIKHELKLNLKKRYPN